MDTHKRPIPPAFLIDARTVSVQDFYAHGDIGLLIPLLAPEYLWDEQEVSQFLADIVNCTQAFLDDRSAILYFGSIVLQQGMDVGECIKPVDRSAMPPRVYTVIDGQQRLATLALIACLLYQRLGALREKLFRGDYVNMQDRLQYLQDAMLKMFTCEVRGALPRCKPILVHGRSDFWTNKEQHRFYHSSIGEFLFKSLNAIWNDEPAPEVPERDALAKPLACINKWLDTITTPQTTDAFPSVWNIRSNLHWIDSLLFAHADISAAACDPSNAETSDVASFIKLFAFTQTLLQRCCFTIITPTTLDAGVSIAETYHQQKNYPPKRNASRSR